ncbi:hypothetical protein PCANC_01927 [Puccinia coronata f. sp. avenae]|uniref:Uncharacterized protein n=1 Tax=Puccinia coronata f. sp. avenae TaxID=200324 RepID=A0A2N5SY52_9BASI|nr:hypothetical protein PCANC_12667 [Puccinia coronata f. sp. avenae]PLW23446.1 hypothetical protein PCASD_12746 [Puccinia coronata f. sp. avenae]PLW57111.1 hypothetical protein PCANC_01927 [Puccinia coronata f. sp. avenae]
MLLYWFLAVFLVSNIGYSVAQDPAVPAPAPVIPASGNAALDVKTLQDFAGQLGSLIDQLEKANVAPTGEDRSAVFTTVAQMSTIAPALASLVTNVATDLTPVLGTAAGSLATALQGVNTQNDVITATVAFATYHWPIQADIAVAIGTLKFFFGSAAGSFFDALKTNGVTQTPDRG